MNHAEALLVGLKGVDPVAYHGWDGKNGCWGCELDVDNMTRILNAQGFVTKSLLTQQATHDNILSSLYRSAENSVAGDVFVFYYSGHGGQQPDFGGDELDGKDETLVAYDREIIDDKIHRVLKAFKSDVHVIMISDSCNSGSNYRGRRDVIVNEESIFTPVARSGRNRDFEINAQVIHLGGCRDGFASEGYYGGGAFTVSLCEAWNNGQFHGSFKALHGKICELIRTGQRPQYSEYGPVSDTFRNHRAFSSVIPLSMQQDDLFIHYQSWTDEISIEKKHMKHMRTEYEYANPFSATPSGQRKLVIVDNALTDQQWTQIKGFVRDSGYENLEDTYGAPKDERYYPYLLSISQDNVRKDTKYRSNPNYDEPPESYQIIERYLFNLSKEVKG